MPSAILHVNLLGDFGIRYGDAPVDSLHAARLQSLLAYLILNSDSLVQRQHLAFQFWPDSPEAHARNSLRQLLFQLRGALPEPDRFLVVDGSVLRWRRDPGQVVDALLFREGLRAARAAEESADLDAARQSLERAIVHYRGDLLPSCYEEWIQPERETLQQLSRAAHRRLAQLQEQARAYAAALETAQAIRRLDPLEEDAYAQQIRLHALMHDPAGARRVYQAAIETFARELGSPPGESVERAYALSQRPAQVADDLAESRLPAVAPATLIGRESEWHVLRSTWARAAKGRPTMLLVTGEAGIGKSRLVEELYVWVNQQGAATARTRSYAAEGRLSLAPVADWLRAPALRAGLASLEDIWQTEASRLLPELLINSQTLPRPQPVVEYGQRQRFFEAMARAVRATAQPLLLLIDDLQWCDVETLEWLHYLLRFDPELALVVAGTARSEESPPDHPLAALTRQLRSEGKLVAVELAPLDAAETARLAAQVHGSELDAEESMRLFRQTEGNPLFVVETMRAGMTGVADAEAAPRAGVHDPRNLPPRVYAVIERRIAQLSASARRVADLGAVVGRAFSWEMLAAAAVPHANDSEETLATVLDELWQRRILREQGPNVYDFTHDNLREVTYAQIGAPQRRLLHRRVARSLETLNADHLDPVSAQIAFHFEQAGAPAQAAPYFQRAGLVAAAVYANDDAIALLNRSLIQLLELPAGAARDAEELKIQFALAALYRMTMGWTSPEEVKAVARTLILTERADNIQQRAQALYGAQKVYVVAGQFDKVDSTYAEMGRLFMEMQGSTPAFAELMHAGARLHMGFAVEAQNFFAEVLAERDDKQIVDLQASQGLNYLALGHAWNAHALWYLGEPAAALDQSTRAVHIARQFAQPFSQALAVTYQALLMELQADFESFQAQAEAALLLAKEYRAPYYRTWASILVNFAHALQDPSTATIGSLRDSIEIFISTGARLRLPYYLSLLARALARAGRPDEGLITLERALGESRQRNERWWTPELHRLRGELLRQRGAEYSEVEDAYGRALEIAQSLHARALELRAATSLAGVWLEQGRAADAKALLIPLYRAFSTSLITPDLEAAQRLLALLE